MGTEILQEIDDGISIITSLSSWTEESTLTHNDVSESVAEEGQMSNPKEEEEEEKNVKLIRSVNTMDISVVYDSDIEETKQQVIHDISSSSPSSWTVSEQSHRIIIQLSPEKCDDQIKDEKQKDVEKIVRTDDA